MFALGGVIAQEIHRLAQLGHGIGQGLAGFLRKDAEDRAEVFFVKIRSPAQHGGAFRSRRVPGARIVDGPRGGCGIGHRHRGDRAARGGIHHVLHSARGA